MEHLKGMERMKHPHIKISLTHFIDLMNHKSLNHINISLTQLFVCLLVLFCFSETDILLLPTSDPPTLASKCYISAILR
jgi:hypothetical protein